MTSQIKYKNWHNFRSRFKLDLTCFLKVIFLEGVLLSKIKFHKIRCRSWSAVPLEGKTKKNSKVSKQYLINITDHWTENYCKEEKNLFLKK